VLTAAACLIVILGLFTDAVGPVGGFLRGFLLGMFGFMGYVAPFAALAVCLVRLFGRGGLFGSVEYILAALLCAMVTAFVHAASPATEYADISSFIVGAYEKGGAGGGVLGASLGELLSLALGRLGAAIVFAAVAIALTMALTGRSLSAGVGRIRSGARAALESARERYAEDEPERRPAIRDTAPKARVSNHVLSGDPDDPDELAPNTLGRVAPGRKVDGDIFSFPKVNAYESQKLEKAEARKPEKTEKLEKQEKEEKEERPEKQDEAPEAPDIVITEKISELEEFMKAGEESAGGRRKKPAKEPVSTAEIDEQARFAPRIDPETYRFPPMSLLNENTETASIASRTQIYENSKKLEQTLKSFGVDARVVEVSKGPTVTRYELAPGAGVKVSKISGLADDLALNLAAVGIRIEAPIPGKSVVGIEIPNKETRTVTIREVLDDAGFAEYPSRLAFAMGKDIAGNTVITDIAKMPHLLIAGATGSGKSVCINTLVTSILYKARPDEAKLLMIDPKVVELSVYNGIPHLLIPVVTDPKKAAGALNWAVNEMTRRYQLFAESGARDMRGYNASVSADGGILPQIVIIIDELADLMMAAPSDVEEAICRLAQMARAAGLHLIIATQRPSVDVITGLIKANIPSRLAFAVSSGTDSRTILDQVGAEKLLGKGDMLFNPVGLSKPQRIQGAFISDKEVELVVAFLKSRSGETYDPEMVEEITAGRRAESEAASVDEMFVEAADFIIEKDKASTSMLQRRFRIGYNRASRLMDELESKGVVGPEDGGKPRRILMSREQWRAYRLKLT
jgi:S-DNA-T family DNA segregation ATPase FtsK/SpoIIIE